MTGSSVARAVAFWSAVLAATACNSITGASSLELDAEFEGANPPNPSDAGAGGTSGSTSAAETGSAAVTSSVTGAGGASTASGSSVASSTGFASSSSSTVVASSASAATAAASVAASTGSGGPVTWPSGPYGVDTGKTVPQNLSWEGYDVGNGGATTLHFADWYDPDGSKGIHAILVITSQYGCGPCTQEAKALPSEIAAWQSQGLNIKVLTLIIDDPYGGYPDLQAANQWKTQYGLVDVAVAADPDWAFSGSSSLATPQQSIVNPRTMKVVNVHQGYSSDYSKLENLAASNL